MKKIAILDNLSLLPETEDQLRTLSESPLLFPTEPITSLENLIERSVGAEVALVSPRTKVPREYFEACPTIKYLGICGTSMGNVDIAEAERRGITITNVKDYGDEPAAEFIFMQLISLLRGTGTYQSSGFRRK